MQIEFEKYYHLYNRSNNEEIVFKSEENYLYFLNKYRLYFDDLLETICYCLMPTHFHFLIKITTQDVTKVQKAVALLLSSYTKAINKRYNRHGSLFQQHTKSKEIPDDRYLLTLMSYIHQNPIRGHLVKHIEEWPYSSYLDFAGFRNGTLPNRKFFLEYFPTPLDFRKYSEEIVNIEK